MGRKNPVSEIITRFIFKLSKGKRGAKTPQLKYQGASLTDIDRYMYENFRSVYEIDSNSSESTTQWTNLSSDGSTSTGSSVKEARMSTGSASLKLDDAMALVTGSSDPYCDFKQSMIEMVEAQHVDGFGGLDWDYLEEMLGYYLELNEKDMHDVIFRAFMDLTEGLLMMRRQSD